VNSNKHVVGGDTSELLRQGGREERRGGREREGRGVEGMREHEKGQEGKESSEYMVGSDKGGGMRSEEESK